MNEMAVAGALPCKVILLATDGSEFSAGVERVGMEMAFQHQSQLYVLRLLLAKSGTDESIVEEQDAMLGLERVGEQCAARGIQYVPLIRPAEEPSQGILAAAREVGAQLVILGRRGRRGMAKLMVGDATTKVIDKADRSVLVVPRLFSYWNSGILLVVDPDQSEGDKAAHAAFRLAQAAQLPLIVLVVADANQDEHRDLNQMANRLVAMAKLQQVVAEGLVQSGDMDDVILEVARQRSADIIVCEPRDRSVIDKLFQTNKLVHLIGRAHCPVLVVQSTAVVA
ncbi:MAG: universal stress protein [Magnetococcus sp. DMHC-8]